MSLPRGTNIGTSTFKPTHPPRCSNMFFLWRTGAVGDCTALGLSPYLPCRHSQRWCSYAASGLQLARSWLEAWAKRTRGCIRLCRFALWYWEGRHQNSLPAAGVAKRPQTSDFALIHMKLVELMIGITPYRFLILKMEDVPYLLSYRICSYDLAKVDGCKYSEKKALVVLVAPAHITDSLLRDQMQLWAWCCLAGS